MKLEVFQQVKCTRVVTFTERKTNNNKQESGCVIVVLDAIEEVNIKVDFVITAN